MAKMSAPAGPPGDPDRILDCEFYLEPAFNDLVDQALGAGWSNNEIDMALVAIARRRFSLVSRCINPT